MTRIRNAGAIFLGEYSSEPLGGLFCRTKPCASDKWHCEVFSLHCRSMTLLRSPVSFPIPEEALELVHQDIEDFATAEKLTAHANSIAVLIRTIIGIQIANF